ncbi:transcriptional regulator [Bacillus canaveralius]|uniref:Transcriptional regulator n=1 Tax=Bacillus canaveralius TaxID=1403243 RepID=A0A2N5GMI5_9BACI|nr:Rrf2 family transcriptional regulator [Bacillus canaveralius]PLR83023.1 transcriptional regulator [Bacillus canaveralius]PLR96973.1 transcriptional regulator [Bacillus canaveralius]
MLTCVHPNVRRKPRVYRSSNRSLVSALICLGNNKDQLTSIGEISEKILVPINYLEQLLLQLKRNGYVQSKRGVNGGYKLSRSPREIIIGEVIRNLEGPLAPMGCVSITSYESCPLEEGCLLKPLWALEVLFSLSKAATSHIQKISIQ